MTSLLPIFAMSRKRRPAPSALLIVDMISEYRFPGANGTLRAARKAVTGITRIKQRARAAGAPVIYVNDTAGKWESDQQAFLQRCLEPSAPGHDVVTAISPEAHDYFMFKPRHSAFFGTPLPNPLQQLKIERLIIVDVTSHQCVLFTATDAHVRDFQIVVPSDCIGAPHPAHSRHALYILSHALEAEITTSRSFRFR